MSRAHLTHHELPPDDHAHERPVFRAFAVAPPLDEFVEYLYFCRIPASFANPAHAFRLPELTSNLVFAIEEGAPSFPGGRPYEGSSYATIFLQGPHVRTLAIPGSFREAVGAALQPAGLRLILPGNALREAPPFVALEDIWGREARDLMDSLVTQRSPTARLGILERALRARLPAIRAPHPIASHAIEHIQAMGDDTTIDEVARVCGCTTRTLYNAVSGACGLTPKEVARVARTRRALTLLKRPGYSLSGAAAEVGFADQAHMTREFRSMRLSTPTNLVARLRSSEALSSAIVTNRSLVDAGLLIHL
jgi:AraC-like DNA-binding protein